MCIFASRPLPTVRLVVVTQKLKMGLSSIDDSFDLSSLVQTTNLTTVIQVVLNTFTINHMSLPSCNVVSLKRLNVRALISHAAHCCGPSSLCLSVHNHLFGRLCSIHSGFSRKNMENWRPSSRRWRKR